MGYDATYLAHERAGRLVELEINNRRAESFYSRYAGKYPPQWKMSRAVVANMTLNYSRGGKCQAYWKIIWEKIGNYDFGA